MQDQILERTAGSARDLHAVLWSDGAMSSHAVVVVDTDGVITSWNDRAVDLFGHDKHSVVGRPVDIIIPEHLREAHWAGFRRAMASPQIKDMAADLPVLCAHGQIREFAGRLLALSDGLGTAIGAIAIYRSEGTTGVRPFSNAPGPSDLGDT
ncbi:MAG: PAS domain S-box protein [Thermocrispum sp.]